MNRICQFGWWSSLQSFESVFGTFCLKKAGRQPCACSGFRRGIPLFPTLGCKDLAQPQRSRWNHQWHSHSFGRSRGCWKMDWSPSRKPLLGLVAQKCLAMWTGRHVGLRKWKGPARAWMSLKKGRRLRILPGLLRRYCDSKKKNSQLMYRSLYLKAERNLFKTKNAPMEHICRPKAGRAHKKLLQTQEQVGDWGNASPGHIVPRLCQFTTQISH